MRTMQRLRVARFVAWVLVALVGSPYLASGALAAERPAPDVYTQTVVLFPLDNLAGDKYGKAAAEVTGHINRGLDMNPRYIVLQYSEQLPAVQRLVSTQPEKKVPTSGPFFSDADAVARALELARTMSADIAMVGSLDACTWDAEKKQATVTGTLEWYGVKTGRKIDTLSATGIKAKPAGAATATEESVTDEAIQELGEKMVVGVTGEEYKAPAPITEQIRKAAPKTRSSKKSWLPMLLISLGVGLLLSGGGGGGGTSSGSGGDELPPQWPSGW